MCQCCVDEGRLTHETYEKIQEFLAHYPRAECGPGHIVLADTNLEDAHIQWCLMLARAALSHNPQVLRSAEDVALMEYVEWYHDHERDELQATIAFLETLLAIPEDER
jgi:hypothetical protein